MFDSGIEDKVIRFGDINKNPRLNDVFKKNNPCPPGIKIDRFESVGGNRLAVMYLMGIASYSTVRIIESRIRNIELSSAKEIQSYLLNILNTKSNIFPLIRKTKKVELARRALRKGSVLIFIDGVQYALVAPSSLAQLLFRIPDYLDCVCPIINKVLNYAALLTSLFLSSLYIAAFSIPMYLLTPEIVQYFADIRMTTLYSALIEVLILEAVAELLREALWVSPPKCSLALSIFGACAIGRILMGWSIFSPVLVMIVSTSLLISFLIPDYLTIHSLRILKFLMIIATGIFGMYGFAILLAVITINIIILTRLGIPYSPFGWYELIHAFLWRTREGAKCK